MVIRLADAVVGGLGGYADIHTPFRLTFNSLFSFKNLGDICVGAARVRLRTPNSADESLHMGTIS